MLSLNQTLLTLLVFSLSLFPVASQSTDAAISNCPPLGPVLPAPQLLSKDQLVLKTATMIEQGLKELTSYNHSAVSIAAQSIHEDAPFFEYHYTPPTVNPKGMKKVTHDTIYRLGSVSKVFTVLAILQLGLPLSDPVTKYVPELLDLGSQNNAVTSFDWRNITLDAMTSQLAGLTGQCTVHGSLHNFSIG